MADLIYPPDKLLLVTDLACLIFSGVFIESYFSLSSEYCKGNGMLFINLVKLIFFFLQRPEERYKTPLGGRRDR